MALFLYNMLLTLFFPLITVFLLYRRAIGKEDAEHWGERWGNYPDAIARDPRSPRFWVHTVSVGELMAAIPVLRELRRRYPGAFILVSTTTIGGREVALKQVPPADDVVYYPLDFSFVVGRALEQVRPDVVVLLEWEIWPNFLVTAKRRGARVVVLNGRISDRGLRRGMRGKFFVRPGFEAVDRFCMQSAEDARRATVVGVVPEKVMTLGNTKFDESTAMLTEEERVALRANLGIPAGVPVWICGSTRPGEEEIIARAQAIVRERFPDLVLIVAPRHLDRADEAAAPFGPYVRRRSANNRPTAPPTPSPMGREGDGNISTNYRSGVDTLLLDTFGELARVYAVADVAFIGGSLLPFGGQSVFQPIAQGVPTLFGPYMSNQRDIAALTMAEGVGFTVRDAATLAQEVIRLLSLPEEEQRVLRGKARALIDRNQGVAARCIDVVEELLAAT